MIRAALLLLAIALNAQELDIHYTPTQTLDLYLPASRNFTTIVYTYGGGWHSGSGKSSQPIAEAFQKKGYACALVSHRLWPPDPFPAQAEDLAAACAWVKHNIARRGGDPNRIVLAGHSSGAHLSLLIATAPGYLAAQQLTPAAIAAVIGVSTPVDLTSHPDRHGYGDVLLAGHGADVFHRDLALMKEASPIEHVSGNLPPTLLLVGGDDFPMLEADAHAFAAKAKAAGRTVEVTLVPGKDHMAMARGLADAHDPVLTRVLEFLQTTRIP